MIMYGTLHQFQAVSDFFLCHIQKIKHQNNFPLFYRNIPYETVRAQFRHYEYNVSAGHRSDGVSGRGELAFAVYRLPVSADLDRSLVLSEKEYFTVSRYRHKHH